MAYGLRYFFRFESQAGADFEIQILQDGYTGSATQRALGRTPVLRRELNDCVAGTSLEFFAECLVDGEFAALYTSDPFEYKVRLLQNSVIIWEGYISTELYSEPDIAPPYDVSITATDGLGELRSATFMTTGRWSLRETLDTILEHTQLGYLVSSISSMYASSPTAVSATDFLDTVDVDFSHLNGESCYDVLQAILASLHMRITQYRQDWLVYRETDVVSTNGALVSYDPFGNAVSNPIGDVGSMTNSAWWPVGRLDSEVVAAKREVTLMSDNHYRQLIPNGEIIEDAAWTIGQHVTYNADGYYVIAAGEPGLIGQTVTLTDATAAGTTPVGQQRVPTRTQGFLSLRILASCMGTGEAEGKLIAMISGTFVDGTTRWLHKGESMYYWKAQNTSDALGEFSLGSPVAVMAEDIATEIVIDFPLYTEGSDTSLVKSLLINVGAGSDTAADGYSRAIYAIVAEFTPQSKGVQTTLKINNGARDLAPEVETILVATEDTANAKYDLRFGIPYVGNTPIYTFGSSKISATDYLSFLAQDYGLSCAIPRLKKTGVLNVPAGSEVPMAFQDTNGILYLQETSAWSLYLDEVEIDMVSTPAATLSVESNVSQEIYAEGTSSYAPTYSPGGSGGGGDTPSSIAWGDITGKPSFAAVATSGSYNDLSNKPTIPSTYAWSAITGKPTTLSGYGITDAYTASTIDNKLSGYLPLSGGTITGSTTSPLTIDTTASWNYLIFAQNGTGKGSVGFYNDTTGMVMQTGAHYINVTADGKHQCDGEYDIIHSGNIGSYNAGSASKLQTARTLWGQSFDGTGDISGNLFITTGNELSIGTGAYSRTQIYSSSLSFYIEARKVSDSASAANVPIYIGWRGGNYPFTIAASGNVLIGTTADNGAKLQVNGLANFTSIYTPPANTFNRWCDSYNSYEITQMSNITEGAPSGYPYGYLTTYRWNNGNWSGQMYFTVADFGGEIFTRGYRDDQGKWTIWRRALLDDGYGNYTASGEVTALGSSSSSDRRLKDIVSRPTPLTLEDIAKLNVISFKWNHRENDKRLKIGLVAQEVQEILPELVGVDRSNYLTLDYSTLGSIVGVMNTKKIFSLEEEVIALRDEVKELRRAIYG